MEIKIKEKTFEVRINEKGLITGVWGDKNDGIYQWRGCYKQNKKYNCWENILPCTKEQFRYRILTKDYKIM